MEDHEREREHAFCRCFGTDRVRLTSQRKQKHRNANEIHRDEHADGEPGQNGVVGGEVGDPEAKPENGSDEVGREPRGADAFLLSEAAVAGGRRSSGWRAGPWRTVPSGAKRDPWQGQSQEDSASFQATVQPMCVHVAETV